MRKLWKFSPVVVVLLAGGLYAAVRHVPQPASFCEVCVARRDVTEWCACGRWHVWTEEKVTATPVSTLLVEKNLCSPHQHTWSETRLATNPQPADAPTVLSLGYLNEPRVVCFLRDVFDYTDKANVGRWRELANKLEYASSLNSALRFCRFPENGFGNAASFQFWWSESAFPLFNRLNEMTELD